MAKLKDDPTTEDAPPLDLQVKVIADAIAKGIVQATNETGPIKQINVTRYRNKNEYNPEGLVPHKRPQFTREYYQNGKMLMADRQYPTDIAILERLHAGRYLNRLVEVVEREAEGGEGKSIEIRYPTASHDQRIVASKSFSSFSDLLAKIAAEQDAEAKAS